MKKGKMNNKGFSLVELIIVIAIMAVLVVVLAPQYLKYVERSRNATDLQNARAIVTACQVWGADPAVPANEAFVDGTFHVKVTGAGNTLEQASTQNTTAFDAALKNAAITKNNIKCKSKTAWTEYMITIAVDKNGITFSYGGADFAKAIEGN